MTTDYVLNRLMNEAIRPNAIRIGEIVAADGIPVVVFEPSDLWKDALRDLGWTGETIFVMPPDVRRILREHDRGTAAWIDRDAAPPSARAFVAIEDQVLLLSCGPGGWSIEPEPDDVH